MTAVVIPFDRRERMRQRRALQPVAAPPPPPVDVAKQRNDAMVDAWFEFWGWK